jgi:hypothetical protein
MNPYTIRAELKKMKGEDLFKLTGHQKASDILKNYPVALLVPL